MPDANDHVDVDLEIDTLGLNIPLVRLGSVSRGFGGSDRWQVPGRRRGEMDDLQREDSREENRIDSAVADSTPKCGEARILDEMVKPVEKVRELERAE